MFWLKWFVIGYRYDHIEPKQPHIVKFVLSIGEK